MISNILQTSVSIVPWEFRKSIKDLPIIAPLQRWLVSRFLDNSQFPYTINAGPAKGLNYPVCLPDDKQIWTGTYELAFSQLLSEAVSPGDVCYDIGGFRGFFSGVLALGGAKQVHTFEPLPENCQQIQKVIGSNPQLPSIKLHKLALGEQSGTVEFLKMPESSMGKLSTSPFQPESKEQEKIRVNVETIDRLIEQGVIAPPHLLKIDVEGAELSVLKGAAQLLQQSQLKLFIEIHSHELARDCHALLTEAGYTTKVLETGTEPNFESDPAVCHFICTKS